MGGDGTWIDKVVKKVEKTEFRESVFQHFVKAITVDDSLGGDPTVGFSFGAGFGGFTFE